MIYFKLNNKIYTEDSLLNHCQDLKINDTYLFNYYRRFLVINRIIKRALNNELKNYPEIDIVINNKKNYSSLGRFCLNYLVNHKEYKIIKKGSPYIVLFTRAIDFEYSFKNVKGLKSTLYHEFIHFKDWLLNNKLGHKQMDRVGSFDKLENDLYNLKRLI